jgi:hypothetical protein
MSPSQRRPADYRVYRSAGLYRRRRLTAILLACALVALALAGAVALAARGGDDTGPGAPAGVADRSGKGAASETPEPSPSETADAAPSVIEIGWVGDTTPGSVYGTPPDGGRALFANVRDELRAPDLMIANLEGTYSTGGPSKCDGVDSSLCFAFQAPPSFAKALPWAGIDLVNMANNHSNDYFEGGLEETKAALEKNGVQYTGLPDQVTIADASGVRVAVIGFSPYSWNADLNDIPAAEELVRRAADQADVVVVLIHAGAEGADQIHTPQGGEFAYGENRGDSRAFAHAVVDAGADLVLGSGPHVIRGIERYHQRLIAYSLGNFAGWDNFGLSGNLGLSGLLTVKIDADGRFRGGRWLSLRLAEPGVPVIDPGHTSARMADNLSDADFSKTWRMDDEGNIKAD